MPHPVYSLTLQILIGQILKQKCSGEKSHTIEAKLLELVPTVMIDDLDKSGAKAEPNFNK
jgi:hypothetical protein